MIGKTIFFGLCGVMAATTCGVGSALAAIAVGAVVYHTLKGVGENLTQAHFDRAEDAIKHRLSNAAKLPVDQRRTEQQWCKAAFRTLDDQRRNAIASNNELAKLGGIGGFNRPELGLITLACSATAAAKAAKYK